MTADTMNMGKRIPWWAVLLEGIAAVILGLLLLASPKQTVIVMVQFLGIWWFVGGIFDIVNMFLDHTAWGWKLFSGILGIIAGIVILNNPLWSAILVPVTLAWMLGIFGIVIGITNLIRAFQGGGWGIGILGVLGIIFGILLIGNALTGAIVLVWLLAIAGIVGGIALIYMAFKMK